MYSQAQVLLLDDSLSAVDANVGRDIFDKAICGKLAVSRTRVLCTHDTRVLPRCHRVLWMEQGRVRGFDSYESLMVREPEFARLVERQEAEKEAARKKKAEKGVGDDDDEIQEDRDDNPQSHARKPKKKDSEEDNLMQEEERAVRSVPWSVYTSFVKWSNSFVLVACVFPVLILAQGGTVLASLWLAWWSSQRFEELTTDEYIAIYISLAAAQAIFTYLFGFILATCCTRSSQAMMRKAVVSVLHAPMSFFDSTPLGRLTNRFSTDVEVTDYSLTEALRMFLTSLSGVAAIFAIIIVYFHWFAIPAGVLVLFLGFLAYYYRTTAREVKRLESTLRSAVFARFIEGLKGAATIRTYGLDVRFGRELRQALDDVNSASFTTYAVQRWLGLRQDAAVVLVVAIMGALVLVDRYRQHPSIAGLVLSLMLNAVQVIQVVVREWADVEGSMNAVERLYEYAVQLPQEEPGRHDDDNNDDDDDDDDITNTKPNPNHPPTSTSTSIQLRPSHTWLRTGSVHFTDVHLHYRPGIPPSLRGVTLHIRAGEHAAIVGRTGAGKSSIINALFRMTEISSGRITIDDTDTATLPLAALRGALSIIPQDANLFAGSVRSNLDPFGALPDAQLWAGLRAAAGLHETLALADEVAHEGANLSQGQRQLLALARVLVRGEANRVLVCDEATAALDAETDDRIQGVLREVFKGRTIICVAHRLRTVLWYDRVYVMDQGRVAEEGSPLELFRREGGLFREMCVKHGLTEEQVVEGANSGR
jgi:ABC-type multidrug transport system fused ATPase/permease subunit